jgi:nodulation protein E
MILGESGAMLVLECRDYAVSRGVPIYGEIAGFGMSSDAYHITQPMPEGAAQAMKMALADAGLHPETIGYINAHGTGAKSNDSCEAGAIRLTFGKHAERLAVSSTKSMHGHTLPILNSVIERWEDMGQATACAAGILVISFASRCSACHRS